MRIYFYKNQIIQVLHDKDEFRGWESGLFPKAQSVLIHSDIYYKKFQEQMTEIESVK